MSQRSRVRIPLKPEFFFRLLFRNCLNCVSTAKIFHNVIYTYIATQIVVHPLQRVTDPIHCDFWFLKPPWANVNKLNIITWANLRITLIATVRVVSVKLRLRSDHLNLHYLIWTNQRWNGEQLQHELAIGMHSDYLAVRDYRGCFLGKCFGSLLLLFYFQAIYLPVLNVWLVFLNKSINDGRMRTKLVILNNLTYAAFTHNMFNSTDFFKLLVVVALASVKIFRTEFNLDGYFQKLFAINFEPKVLLCWKINFKPVVKQL